MYRQHRTLTGAAAVMMRLSVLAADPELARCLDAERIAAAGPASLAAVVLAAPGAWKPDDELLRTSGGYGLLMLDGLLMRRLELGGRAGAELLGAGDLLGDPDREDAEPSSLAFASTWRVIESSRLARLDGPWATRMAGFPEIGGALAERAIARSTRLATAIALAQQPHLDERVWMLFWHLADRFGRVHPDGVHLDLPLTHELLSQLALARRPSITAALARLAVAGRLRRSGGAWILTGEPPREGSAP
jgi:CRP/FNR family transcriptional regulator, cyclic AMP receptor protein